MVYYTKSNIIPVVHLYKKQFVIIGASAPNPDLLFVLTLKRQAKKVRTAPASLEKKLAFNWLKPFKLAPSSLKQDSYFRQFHCFLATLTVGSAHQTIV